ncbi:hypothetical protein OK016_13725 [Vibrio chagasii]|nr:hypothetical protein [Vibrio chagasii]
MGGGIGGGSSNAAIRVSGREYHLVATGIFSDDQLCRDRSEPWRWMYQCLVRGHAAPWKGAGGS